jgi:hypothetical protein
MNEKVAERISIIDNYRSMIRYNDRTPDQQYRYIRWFGSVEFVIGLLSWLLLISISTMKMLKIGDWDLRWEKAGLLVLLLVSMSLVSQFLFIEKILKSHRQKIQSLDHDFNGNLNTDLQVTVTRISSNSERIGMVGVPSIIVFAGAFAQFLEMNPIWDLFAYLTAAYGVYALARAFYNINSIKRNIKQFEKVRS